MRVVRGKDDKLISVELAREEMRELLAFEATCACLIPKPRRAFLEATMRNYRIPVEEMLPFLEKASFNREDVWKLQTLKRRSDGNERALEVLGSLRRLEAELGGDVLGKYVDRRRIAPSY